MDRKVPRIVLVTLLIIAAALIVLVILRAADGWIIPGHNR